MRFVLRQSVISGVILNRFVPPKADRSVYVTAILTTKYAGATAHLPIWSIWRQERGELVVMRQQSLPFGCYLELLQHRRRTHETGHQRNTIAAIADRACRKFSRVVQPAVRARETVADRSWARLLSCAEFT